MAKNQAERVQEKISNKPTNKPVKPEVKTQAAGKAPILDWINYNNKTFGNNKEPITAAEARVAKSVDQYGNQERATDRIQEQDRAKKAPKMSATRSWQIIKDSMSKDELEEHYKEHPKERPVKLMPVKLDQGLTDMLGNDEDDVFAMSYFELDS